MAAGHVHLYRSLQRHMDCVLQETGTTQRPHQHRRCMAAWRVQELHYVYVPKGDMHLMYLNQPHCECLPKARFFQAHTYLGNLGAWLNRQKLQHAVLSCPCSHERVRLVSDTGFCGLTGCWTLQTHLAFFGFWNITSQPDSAPTCQCI